jgi:hypothetical protein
MISLQMGIFDVDNGMTILKAGMNPPRSLFNRTMTQFFMSVITCVFVASNSMGRADEKAEKVENPGAFEGQLREQTGKFLTSLNADQLAACMQEMDTKKRWHKQYTGGKREGVQIKDLNAEQKKAMEVLFKLVLSDYGWKMAETVAKQDGEQGLDKYYIACFGDPRKEGAPFALRLCEHHLTVVNLEIAGGKLTEFGPILLGANPPVLWQKDEEILMKAWVQQTVDHGHKDLLEEGEGASSELMPADDGVEFTTLTEETQATLKEAWNHRLEMFTPVIKERINALQKARGGWEKSRVAFYKNPADKRSKDGGMWDFKCGLPGMVWDFECSRGHIHMSLCIHPEN